jgi:hypothetical protein
MREWFYVTSALGEKFLLDNKSSDKKFKYLMIGILPVFDRYDPYRDFMSDAKYYSMLE